MKTRKLLLFAALFGALVVLTGCQTTQAEAEEEEVEMPGFVEAEIDSDPVELKKSVPETVTVGETVEYVYTIEAETAVRAVVLTDEIPAGMTYVSSEPAASRAGNALTWSLPDMEAEGEQVVVLRLRAGEPGRYTNCAEVTAVPVACTTVEVVEAD